MDTTFCARLKALVTHGMEPQLYRPLTEQLSQLMASRNTANLLDKWLLNLMCDRRSGVARYMIMEAEPYRERVVALLNEQLAGRNPTHKWDSLAAEVSALRARLERLNTTTYVPALSLRVVEHICALYGSDPAWGNSRLSNLGVALRQCLARGMSGRAQNQAATRLARALVKTLECQYVTGTPHPTVPAAAAAM